MPCAECERLDTAWTSISKRLQEQKTVNRKSGIADTARGREVIASLEMQLQEASDRLNQHRETCQIYRKAAGLE